MGTSSSFRRWLGVLGVALALLAACNQRTPPGETPPASEETPPLPTETAPPPTLTPTPVPLALRVNGEGVPLAEFQAGMTQIEAAVQTLGETLTPEEQRRRVLDDLIDTTLLAQAARAGGYQVDEADLQARMQEIVTAQGGEAAFAAWQTQMGYTPESFRSALRRGLEAAWQRDRILDSVPSSAEQVHARQILVLTEDAARQVKQQLSQAGANFATLAFGYDLSTGGDLGWFPRGYLTQPAVEEAAFSLQPGEISDIIPTDFGYHILQVIAREANRPLEPEVRRVLGRKALKQWLEDQRRQAQVEELVP
jgi:peptidyl-prolyl cis-trans isomerase C